LLSDACDTRLHDALTTQHYR